MAFTPRLAWLGGHEVHARLTERGKEVLCVCVRRFYNGDIWDAHMTLFTDSVNGPEAVLPTSTSRDNGPIVSYAIVADDSLPQKRPSYYYLEYEIPIASVPEEFLSHMASVVAGDEGALAGLIDSIPEQAGESWVPKELAEKLSLILEQNG